MSFNGSNYVGRKIELYPEKPETKYGIIEDVDDLGFTIRITEALNCACKKNDIIFISHSSELDFKFLSLNNTEDYIS